MKDLMRIPKKLWILVYNLKSELNLNSPDDQVPYEEFSDEEENF